MNIFDIIGPVMIGPSSSHTAGAVRLGRVANKLMDGRPPKQVEITLSGSFAQTYKGHGTDRALLAGIMGYHSYSPEIRDALSIADEVVLAPIYAARETDNLGISSDTLRQNIANRGTDAWYFPDFERIEDFLLQHAADGDLVITVGAGDIVRVGEEMLAKDAAENV